MNCLVYPAVWPDTLYNILMHYIIFILIAIFRKYSPIYELFIITVPYKFMHVYTVDWFRKCSQIVCIAFEKFVWCQISMPLNLIIFILINAWVTQSDGSVMDSPCTYQHRHYLISYFFYFVPFKRQQDS